MKRISLILLLIFLFSCIDNPVGIKKVKTDTLNMTLDQKPYTLTKSITINGINYGLIGAGQKITIKIPYGDNWLILDDGLIWSEDYFFITKDTTIIIDW